MSLEFSLSACPAPPCSSFDLAVKHPIQGRVFEKTCKDNQYYSLVVKMPQNVGV